MLDLNLFEDQFEKLQENLARRNFDAKILESIRDLNKKRKTEIGSVEELRGTIKSKSKQVGDLKKSGQDASDLMSEVSGLKEKLKTEEENLSEIENELSQTLMGVPNLISEDTPLGKDENDNKEVEKWGSPREFDFSVKDHITLGEQAQCLDFETAVKLTGARFSLFQGDLALLERGLANYMLDYHVERGYTEASVPFIVQRSSLEGTGQLPKFQEDLFKLEERDWFLIPTAEVPLTNLVREEIVDKLPLKYTAHTPCFRSEAGSYGKDTRGLIRLHQFTKVEMVQITDEESSEQALEDMVDHARGILRELEIPYRIVQLCTGDIGFSARKTYDFEVWLPAQKKYREISSISNCWDFQARRAKVRYKPAGEKKTRFAHTLNGSGLAVGRTIVALLENHQNEDGSVSIPVALQRYLGGKEVIFKR